MTILDCLEDCLERKGVQAADRFTVIRVLWDRLSDNLIQIVHQYASNVDELTPPDSSAIFDGWNVSGDIVSVYFHLVGTLGIIPLCFDIPLEYLEGTPEQREQIVAEKNRSYARELEEKRAQEAMRLSEIHKKKVEEALKILEKEGYTVLRGYDG